MNKTMMKKAQKLSINPERLDNNIEVYPVEWLLSDRKVNGYPSGLDMIKDTILCMDQNHENYNRLSNDKKNVLSEFFEHEGIIDAVLVTLFQWFGTNVGKYEIGKLLDEIRTLKYEPESIHMLIRDES